MNVQTDVQNPFHVMDVPNPDDSEVLAFAASAALAGNEGDDNAAAWGPERGQA